MMNKQYSHQEVSFASGRLGRYTTWRNVIKDESADEALLELSEEHEKTTWSGDGVQGHVNKENSEKNCAKKLQKLLATYH